MRCLGNENKRRKQEPSHLGSVPMLKTERFTLKVGRSSVGSLSRDDGFWGGYTATRLTEAWSRNGEGRGGAWGWQKVTNSLAGHWTPGPGAQKGTWGRGHVGEPEGADVPRQEVSRVGRKEGQQQNSGAH